METSSPPLRRLTKTASPISTSTVALAGVSFSTLRSSPKSEKLYFACADPANGGKSMVKALIPATGEVQACTPLEQNVRSAVHEYGGGSFGVLGGDDEEDTIVFTDFPQHAVYKTHAAGVQQIFPCAETETSVRFADFCSDATRKRVICVMEDHAKPQPADVVNTLVALSLEESVEERLTTLASGRDFYSTPRINSRATLLAHVFWDHPNMPWDSTAISIQRLDGTTGGEAILGSDNDASLAEPRWIPGTDTLVFLSDISGWYNLYTCAVQVQDDGSLTLGETKALYPKEADFTIGPCGWMLGCTPYDILPDGTIVAAYDETIVLIRMDLSSGEAVKVEEFGRSCIPPSSISSLCVVKNSLYFVGGSVQEPSSLWQWEVPGDKDCVARLVLPSMKDGDKILSTLAPFMSEPRRVQFPSEGGVGYAFGYFYPPNNLSEGLLHDKDFKPPLLVKAHGGPTGSTSSTFRLDIQFWTSRGFAILDVDYGGSTGYGKKFRQSLYGKWGVVDVNDVCAGAQWCVDQGWVHAKWLCIDGGSAGGYTTLAALTFRDVFAAGASKYGISDLGALYKETHKFESRYMDLLIGPYPKEIATYEERCPIRFPTELNCPVILLHGEEDKVVPLNQAQLLYDSLQSKHIDTVLLVYKGEQHGFRKAKNIRHALQSEYAFFCKTFHFETQQEEDLEEVPMGTRREMT